MTESGAAHQLGHAGHFCLDGCRLEKSYRHWGHDIGPDDSPLETELGFTVAWNKPSGFIGREALVFQKENGLVRCHSLFEVNAEAPLLLHDEPVYTEGRLVGRTTSGGLGFRTNKALCFAKVKIPSGSTRRETLAGGFEIEIAGERYPMRALLRPPYDPKGVKLRL